MSFYITFCLGLFVGSVIALIFIKKQLRDEFDSKYSGDIEQYKKIINDFNIEVTELEDENKKMREQLFALNADDISTDNSENVFA